MAEIFPNEGLDLVIAIVPKNGTNAASTYIGLFTTFTATTVGTGSNPQASYTEPSGGAYARQTIGSASWGGTANEPGRKTTAGQVTMPTATAVWGTVNGFFLSSTVTAASGSCYFACNFDDTTA